MAKKRKLYTVYRTKDDALVVFEEPAERAAEILGIKATSLYAKVSHQKSGLFKKPKYRVEVTRIADLDDEEEDDGEW